MTTAGDSNHFPREQKCVPPPPFRRVGGPACRGGSCLLRTPLFRRLPCLETEGRMAIGAQTLSAWRRCPRAPRAWGPCWGRCRERGGGSHCCTHLRTLPPRQADVPSRISHGIRHRHSPFAAGARGIVGAARPAAPAHSPPFSHPPLAPPQPRPPLSPAPLPRPCGSHRHRPAASHDSDRWVVVPLAATGTARTSRTPPTPHPAPAAAPADAAGAQVP